jgi:hypothetical protein
MNTENFSALILPERKKESHTYLYISESFRNFHPEYILSRDQMEIPRWNST